MSALQVYDPRERALVSAADWIMATAAAVVRPFRRRAPPTDPRRILLLRIERIGDLLMTIRAIDDVRALAPEAEVDLVVGGWNQALARAIPGVTTVETLDAEWLSREGAGVAMPQLLRAAWRWRARRYDLAINFEPDVRSNMMLAAAGAAWTAGFRSGGGGPLLDLSLDYDPKAHTTDNARRLVAEVFQRTVPASTRRLIEVPVDSACAATRRLEGSNRPLVGIHASGGREIKQWAPERFADTARRLIERRDATIVLTGATTDRPLVTRVKEGLPLNRVVDASGDLDLLELAAVLQRLDLFVTGDTGPMHLAATMQTPVVAVFGPSTPARYAPRNPLDRVVRVDLPCSPCNRIRLPPERCRGHIPDCLALVSVDAVADAAMSVLDSVAGRRP
ncbi:MAG: glycosyltransferase family 9 protein [Acidobacteria bacterium]|nr:glycosyltransferase family 9 protein [Acidobacteriota bacterium]